MGPGLVCCESVLVALNFSKSPISLKPSAVAITVPDSMTVHPTRELRRHLTDFITPTTIVFTIC